MRNDPSGDSKALIRRRVRAQRAAMSAPDRVRAAAQLTDQLIALSKSHGARTIACFSSMPTEPDTSGFLEWALARGHSLLLPVSLPNSQLDWVRYRGEKEAGRHGISEPVGKRLGQAALDSADLVLVPACAVDDFGVRLGWGMGYYDRCLAALDPGIPVYAVVFDADRFDRLPRDPHDVPVTGVVTQSAAIEFLSGTD